MVRSWLTWLGVYGIGVTLDRRGSAIGWCEEVLVGVVGREVGAERKCGINGN